MVLASMPKRGFRHCLLDLVAEGNLGPDLLQVGRRTDQK